MSDSLRPKLLKLIPENTEQEIYDYLNILRTKYPSYRDDQLFVYWIGKLMLNQGLKNNFQIELDELK